MHCDAEDHKPTSIARAFYDVTKEVFAGRDFKSSGQDDQKEGPDLSDPNSLF